MLLARRIDHVDLAKAALDDVAPLGVFRAVDEAVAFHRREPVGPFELSCHLGVEDERHLGFDERPLLVRPNGVQDPGVDGLDEIVLFGLVQDPEVDRLDLDCPEDAPVLAVDDAVLGLAVRDDGGHRGLLVGPKPLFGEHVAEQIGNLDVEPLLADAHVERGDEADDRHRDVDAEGKVA